MLDTITRIVELLDEQGQTLSSEQKKLLRQIYTNNVSASFEVAHENDLTVFRFNSEDGYKNALYYMGLEYEADCQTILIKCDEEVIVAYEGSDRVENILHGVGLLDEDEEEAIK